MSLTFVQQQIIDTPGNLIVRAKAQAARVAVSTIEPSVFNQVIKTSGVRQQEQSSDPAS